VTRVRELDGLRGIAILLVLIWHYVIVPADTVPGSKLAYLLAIGRLTWSGVDLFFVLSGFLIGGILLDAKDSTNYFSVFYRRRFFRILPLYAVVLVIVWAMPGNAWLKADLLPWWSYATLTQNFMMAVRNTLGGNALAITWSLAIEEQFYLTFPLVVRFTSRKTLKRILLLFIILAPAIRLLVFLRLGPTAAYVLMPCRADALLIGVGIAALKRENDSIPYVGPLIISAVILAVCIFKSWGGGSFEMSVWGYSIVAVFYGSLLCAVLDRRPRVLRLGWLCGLGIIAYATYLFHQTLQGLLYWKLFAMNPILRIGTVMAALLALCLTLVLARISWDYFERPLISRGHHSRYSFKNDSLEII